MVLMFCDIPGDVEAPPTCANAVIGSVEQLYMQIISSRQAVHEKIFNLLTRAIDREEIEYVHVYEV